MPGQARHEDKVSNLQGAVNGRKLAVGLLLVPADDGVFYNGFKSEAICRPSRPSSNSYETF